jgi:hypothetical protein
MQRCRKGEGCGVDPAVLEQGFATSPYAGQLVPDRAALLAWLASPGAPAAEKRELVEALFDAAAIDAAAEAWGRPPPLGAKAMLEAAVPVRILAAAGAPPLAEARPLPPMSSASRGHWLLASWATPEDRAYPWLSPTVGHPTTEEMIGLAIARGGSDGRWDPTVHRHLAGTVDLGPDPASLGVRFTVRCLIGNLRTPTMLRLEAGKLVLPIFAVADDRRQEWKFETFPEERLEVDLPAWALVPGLNEIELTTRPMPGLPRWRGIDADRLTLALE